MGSALFDWRIQDIERTANEAKNRLWELDNLRNETHRLEHSLQNAKTEIEYLKNELNRVLDRVINLEAIANDTGHS